MSSSRKDDREHAPHFKDSHAKHPLNKAAMDPEEYKPSDAPYALPHPVW